MLSFVNVEHSQGPHLSLGGKDPILTSMFIYGKMASNAIAVMSYLAANPAKQAGSKEIAEARGISQALTAKLLTRLATAGLVTGRPGPGGGYRIAKSPDNICLADIVHLFEQATLPSLCPFGHNWCGIKAPCPLHDPIARLVKQNQEFIQTTRLSAFESKKDGMPLPQNTENIR